VLIAPRRRRGERDWTSTVCIGYEQND